MRDKLSANARRIFEWQVTTTTPAGTITTGRLTPEARAALTVSDPRPPMLPVALVHQRRRPWWRRIFG